MLCLYDDLCSIICTVLRGRYCVSQHSCCNANKTITYYIYYIDIADILGSKISVGLTIDIDKGDVDPALHKSLHPKQDLDPFSRFADQSRVKVCDRQTDRRPG